MKKVLSLASEGIMWFLITTTMLGGMSFAACAIAITTPDMIGCVLLFILGAVILSGMVMIDVIIIKSTISDVKRRLAPIDPQIQISITVRRDQKGNIIQRLQPEGYMIFDDLPSDKGLSDEEIDDMYEDYLKSKSIVTTPDSDLPF